MPTDWEPNQLPSETLLPNGRVCEDALIKAHRNNETGEITIQTSKLSNDYSYIECFDSGADTQTQIAMLSSIQGNMLAVPITKKLVTAVEEMFPKINAKLDARFKEFTTKRQIHRGLYDDLRCARIREQRSEPDTEQPLNPEVFLSKLCRTGTFPIDSDETFLIVAACAQFAAYFCSYDSGGLEVAYQCVEALFVHNNRRL
mmetsp:Transcript_9246/g.19860  ORF Transcript_9246/g.19860 Transcript_9246/m.19860 type:complete len:201 (-) Transcript_9246:2-604(-)